MAIERKWLAIPAQPLTANGTSYGGINVASTRGYRTKMIVGIFSDTVQPIAYQVKEVVSETEMIIGLKGPEVGRQAGTDLTRWTTLDNAQIRAAEQEKTNIPEKDHYSAIYEADPVVADRVIQVDEEGNFYGPGNPMPIAFDGTVQVGNVTIQDDDGDELNINSDGSINVNILPSTSGDNTVRNTFGVASAVPGGATTTIVTYTCPTGVRALLQRSVCSGTNKGDYTLAVNGVTQSILRTYYSGEFNVTFDFTTGQENGLVLEAGDVVTVKILHNRPFLGDFDGRIQVFEVTL